MSKSEEIKVNITSRATHRGLEKSTTLNRRYVKRPTKLIVTDGTEPVEITEEIVEEKAEKRIEIDAPKISHINISTPEEKAEEVVEEKVVSEPEVEEVPDEPPAPNPYQAAIDARKAENEKKRAKEVSSRALKDAAIAKALAEMEVQKEEKVSKAELREERIAEKVMLSEMKADAKKSKKEKKKVAKEPRHLKKRKGGRILLALATSTACVIALAAIVKVNLPNISVKVAAVQTGVEASYPSYIPRDFNLSGVYTNNQNSVIIEFQGPNSTSFSLAEEKSSWDSNALLANYVKGAYGDAYDTVREQGTTIYINHSNAAWVKNGTFYKLTANAGVLSKKQIKSIVGSL